MVPVLHCAVGRLDIESRNAHITGFLHRAVWSTIRVIGFHLLEAEIRKKRAFPPIHRAPEGALVLANQRAARGSTRRHVHHPRAIVAADEAVDARGVFQSIPGSKSVRSHVKITRDPPTARNMVEIGTSVAATGEHATNACLPVA